MAESKPKRRWWFSLRTQLVASLTLLVAMGWFTVKMRQADPRRNAVEAIRKAGGYVLHDYGGSTVPPRWLTNWIGHEFFTDVIEVRFYCPEEIGDVDVEVVVQHTKGKVHISSLDLGGTEVTDTSLQRIEALTTLETLKLSATQITGAGLEHLKGLVNLEELALAATEVNDAGLSNLQGLTNLQRLDIRGTHVTNAGLNHLKSLGSLEVLDLYSTPVTEEGIEGLRNVNQWRADVGI
ncbi:MAG: hypothetical protein H8E44_34540, partial [Planctomycetes bacterium]|nr:hypothetical protein [Planctomycetota bacterium]